MSRLTITFGVVLLAVGCGGGAKRLSKDEYTKQADAICSTYNKKISALGRPTNFKGLPSYVDRALPVARKGNEELRALKAPKDEEKTAKEWLDQNAAVVASMERLRDAAKKGDRAAIQVALGEASTANGAANRLARKLDLHVCARG
jgi:hypothetical protein